MSRSMTSTRGPAPASKCSTPTARWRRSGGAALVGSGGLAGAVFHLVDWRTARSLRAIRPIGTLYWRQALRANLGIEQIETGVFFHAWGSRAKFAYVRECLFDGYWTTFR